MIRTYSLKMYPNLKKATELNKLISFWRDHVNHKIKTFWFFDSVKSVYPPKEHAKGGRLVRDASVKAWQVVKHARATEQKERPTFNGTEIDLNEFSSYIIEGLQTKEFDLWLNVISLTPHSRLKIPCKKHRNFNIALEKGKLRKSMRIIKKDSEYYLKLFVDMPKANVLSNQVVGLDVGLNKTVVASDGKIFGEELKVLRVKTKWRNYYKNPSPFKQGLNRVVKEIVKEYPNCNFAVEKLLFKGKKGCSRKFRRNKKNWAYTHLSHQLEEMGGLEGFRVYKVNPAYTSVRCPVCGFTSNTNRQCVDIFKCGHCEFTGDADHIGAWNIAERVVQEHPFLRLTVGNISPPFNINVGGG